MGLLTAFSGSALYQLVPIIAPIAVGVVFLWILSVFGLSTRFKALTAGDAQKTTEPAAKPAIKGEPEQVAG
jgi:AAA family ATP:ADP antiporter